jgi:hypothetical protein
VVRWVVAVLLLCFSSVAAADPILLLLLRFARDRAITASLEAGATSMQQQYSTIPSPSYGFALPTPPVPLGQEEQQLRVLLDENFLHLTVEQRNEVFVGLQKILRDPQHARDKGMIVAEFTITARAVRESYRGLEVLSYAEKKSLALQAREEYRQLPAAERRELVGILQSGSLPVPRDLRDIMLAEFNSVAPAGAETARP